MWPSEINRTLICWILTAMHQVCFCLLSLIPQYDAYAKYSIYSFWGDRNEIQRWNSLPKVTHLKSVPRFKPCPYQCLSFLYLVVSHYLWLLFLHCDINGNLMICFLLFKCKSMASSKSCKELCSSASWITEGNPRAAVRAPSIRAGSW